MVLAKRVRLNLWEHMQRAKAVVTHNRWRWKTWSRLRSIYRLVCILEPVPWAVCVSLAGTLMSLLIYMHGYWFVVSTQDSQFNRANEFSDGLHLGNCELMDLSTGGWHSPRNSCKQLIERRRKPHLLCDICHSEISVCVFSGWNLLYK